MNTTYFARIYDPFGRYRTTIAQFGAADGPALHYVLNSSPGGVGACELTVPGTVDPSLFVEDGRVLIFRAIGGRAPILDTGAIFLMREVADTAHATTVSCDHANSLLHTRLIAYPSDTAFVVKAAAPADDQIKALCRQNLGGAIVGASRYGSETQADLSAELQIAPDLGQAAAVPVADIAQRYLDEVAAELCQESATKGVYVTYMVEAISPQLLELRTYVGQRGVDRRAGQGQPLIFSEARGTLEQARVVRSWRDAATVVYAGGAGDGSARLILPAYDWARAAASPFGRREAFVEASDTDDLVVLQGVADSALRAARPRQILTADLRETDSAIRGIHFDLGDLATAEHPRTRQQFDVRIDLIDVTISATERTTKIGLRSL